MNQKIVKQYLEVKTDIRYLLSSKTQKPKFEEDGSIEFKDQDDKYKRFL